MAALRPWGSAPSDIGGGPSADNEESRAMNEAAATPATVQGGATARQPAVGQRLDLSGARTRNVSERIIGLLLFACGALSILTTVGIVAVLIVEAVEFFRAVSIWDFLTGTEWRPNKNVDRGQWGVLPLVAATLTYAVIAMCVALPVGLMTAIYLSEYARAAVRTYFKPILEVLAGVPTVVYGFFALTFLTPEVLQRISSG